MGGEIYCRSRLEFEASASAQAGALRKCLQEAISALKGEAARASDVHGIVKHDKFFKGIPDGIGKKLSRYLNGKPQVFAEEPQRGSVASKFCKEFLFSEPPAPKSAAPPKDENAMDEMRADEIQICLYVYCLQSLPTRVA